MKFPVPIGKQTVTLYTFMIRYMDQSILMVLLSDNNDHDKTTVVPYTVYVLKYIKKHFGDNVLDIEIWTYWPSSQFKNKYIFVFIGITLPQLIVYKVFWNYSATSHGKGAVDGVGGTIKWVEKKTKSHPAVMAQEYIESTIWDLDMHILWQDINALPGTMHIHRVEQTDMGNVSTSMFYSDWSCNIHPLNSVDLAVVDKHQDTNVNVRDFVIVKYKATQASSFGTKPVSNSKHSGT